VYPDGLRSCCAGGAVPGPQCHPGPMPAPDIVVVLSDQQRPDSCGVYGQALSVTPNLDAMASEGVVFEHAFTVQPTPGSIWLQAIVADGQITVTIADNGSWRPPTDSGGYRGRGLPLIHQLTEARIAPSPYGTTVFIRRQLPAERYDELTSL